MSKDLCFNFPHADITKNITGAMRAHRVGDALLRPGPSPLLSFLAPSICPTWLSVPRQQPLPSIRFLATKTLPLNASAATAAKAEDDEFLQHSRHQPAPTPPKRLDSVQALTAQIQSSNRGKPRKNPTASYNSPRYDSRGPSLSSAELFRNANSENQRSGGYLKREQGKIDESFFPNDSSFGGLDAGDLVGSSTFAPTAVPPPPTPVRLDAFIGRSEEVAPERGIDLGRALKKLELKCAYNNVRGDSISQRFHERPGLKRKRLKSSRWRKRFKEGFRAVVAKVQKMKNRGW
ncbi:hypothetical protein MMC13_007205 [Lambiella insularis]|nr:hypothetical protein [Lambiella insularis]